MNALEEEVALVTGGGRGLGAAVAAELGSRGAAVAIVDLDQAAAEAIARELGPPAIGLEADVTDPAFVDRAVEEMAARLGEPTVLVNSAGINRTGPTEELTRERWASVVDVNLNGTFTCCQIVGRRMLRAGRGAIVNIASSNSEVGSPGRAAYCASKSAVVGLTRALAVEWAARGIRVNAVAPGYVLTPLLQSCFDQGLIDRDYLLGRIPAARLGQPGDVAKAVAFLASADSAYIVGEVIAVDGGYLAYGGPQPSSAGAGRPVDQRGAER